MPHNHNLTNYPQDHNRIAQPTGRGMLNMEISTHTAEKRDRAQRSQGQLPLRVPSSPFLGN